jgi:C4-dicarboxylate transporter DctM subunit
MIAASRRRVLLAIPSFVFAGFLLERAAMSNSLVELARALVGWVRGVLGMSVIAVSYFFSDIRGLEMAEVSAPAPRSCRHRNERATGARMPPR